jgi:hypothetical protein
MVKIVEYDSLTENFPFLTVGKYIDQDIVGIVQNMDNQLTSIYVYNKIHDENLKKAFIELGSIWWWESNRMNPINVFLRDKFRPFREYLQTFATKDFELICGPTVNLDDQLLKRVKKRTVILVRRMP